MTSTAAAIPAPIAAATAVVAAAAAASATAPAGQESDDHHGVVTLAGLDRSGGEDDPLSIGSVGNGDDDSTGQEDNAAAGDVHEREMQAAVAAAGVGDDNIDVGLPANKKSNRRRRKVPNISIIDSEDDDNDPDFQRAKEVVPHVVSVGITGVD